MLNEVETWRMIAYVYWMFGWVMCYSAHYDRFDNQSDRLRWLAASSMWPYLFLSKLAFVLVVAVYGTLYGVPAGLMCGHIPGEKRTINF